MWKRLRDIFGSSPPPPPFEVPPQPTKTLQIKVPPQTPEEEEILQIIEQAFFDGVTKLDLSNKGLKKVPPEIGQLTNLTTLNLSGHWGGRTQLSSLPPEIGQLTNLTTLNLSGNGLSTLPPEIGQLTNLTTLDLSGRWGGRTQLSSLPPEIGQLTNLTTLNLSYNKLNILPPKIRQLRNLTTLDLSHNKLSTLPLEIGPLTNLTTLKLSGNRLQIPRRILRTNDPAPIIKYYLQGDLQARQIIKQALKDGVTELNLSDKEIAKLPPEIGQLTNLTRLDLSGNELSTLPSEIGQLTNLTRLDLSHNGLSTLPPEIGQLTNLRELYLTYNLNAAQEIWLLRQLPPEIGQLTNLTLLHVGGQQALNTLPPEIGNLTNLTRLILYETGLKELPSEIGKLCNLQHLELRWSRLSTLPSEIGQLTNLTELYLASQTLSVLPPEIGNLTNLKKLRLSGEREEAVLSGGFIDSYELSNLCTLPPEIGKLINLQELDLSYNQLSLLPPEMTQLTNLKSLHLHYNQLRIPPEILWRTDEPATILDYYFRGKLLLNEAKLVFVGQGRVGKTSLVKRLVEKQFDEKEAITEGIAIKKWGVRVKDTQIKLNIWDFGGQEIMHATHQFFLTIRTLYVLVFDVQKDEASNRVEYWLKLISSFGQNSPVIVVSNQTDQPRKLFLNQGELTKTYPNIKAFVNTSCKTEQGLNELVRQITRLIDELAHVRDEIPIEWLAVKRQLERLGKDYVGYDGYVQLCEANDVRKQQEQRVLIRLLHDLGVVLNFQDDARLRDTGVLNPQWVTGGVYKIINAKSIAQNKGILEIGQLDHILTPTQQYPKEKHLFIIDMMRKFELCFDLDGHLGERFLIPDLLPSFDAPFLPPVDRLNFEYHYNFLPSSVMSRLIVRMNRFIFEDSYWRNEVFLVHNANQATVKALLNSKKIIISIAGAQKGRQEQWKQKWRNPEITGIML